MMAEGKEAAAPTNRFDSVVGGRLGVEPERVREFRDATKEAGAAAFNTMKDKVVGAAKEGVRLTAEGVKSGLNTWKQWRESRANHRTVENGTVQIDLKQAELEGIEQQVLSVSPEEALAMRGRQRALRGEIGKLAAERQRAAGELANYHGAKIEKPRADAEVQANAIRGLNERMRASEQARDRASATFNVINREISIRDARGEDTSYLLQKMQEFGKQISDHTASINVLNQRLGTAQSTLEGIRAKHGKKIDFAQQLRGIQGDGLDGTLAKKVARVETARPAPAAEVTSVPKRPRVEAASPESGDTSESVRPEDYRAMLEGLTKFIGKLPGQLREALGKLKGVDKLPEKLDTESIIDSWNAIAKQDGSGVKEIEASDKRTLREMLPSKTSFADFGMAMRLYVRRPQEEVLRGIVGTAQKILGSEEARKTKAA